MSGWCSCQCVALTPYRELLSVGFLRNIGNAALCLVPVNFLRFAFSSSANHFYPWFIPLEDGIPYLNPITHESMNGLEQ